MHWSAKSPVLLPQQLRKQVSAMADDFSRVGLPDAGEDDWEDKTMPTAMVKGQRAKVVYA